VASINSHKDRRWRLTIFPKLFLAFMLLIAPLYGIGLLMNKTGEAKLVDELSHSLESKTDFYLNILEMENEHMISLLQQYMNDKDLQHLTYLSGTMTLFEFTEVIRSVQVKLEQLKGSSIYALRTNAHILTLNRSLSNEESISSELNPDFEAVQSLTETSGTRFFYWHGRMFLAISYPGIESVAIYPGFILSIELDLQAVKNALSVFEDHEQSGAALIHTKYDMVLTNNKNASLSDFLKQFIADKYRSGHRDGIEQVMYDGKQYFMSYRYSPVLEYYLIAYTPVEQMLGSLDQYRDLLWLLSFLSLFIVLAYSYWIFRLIHRPLQNLIKAFRKAELGQLTPTGLPKSNDEFLYLFQRFNMMMENLNVLIHEAYEQKLRIQSSELKQLQAQINPHFLYNTYFILYRLAKLNDNESIAQFSQYLGQYFQFITRNAAEDVPLELEFRHSKIYAEIQSIRFKGRIHVDFDELPAESLAVVVPRLILQPIIENSYKHGLETRSKNGFIHVGVSTESNCLFITVEDDGQPLSAEKFTQLLSSLSLQQGELEYTGLLNVHRRLQIRFGQDFGVTVERSELGGLKVTLKLPRVTAQVSTLEG